MRPIWAAMLVLSLGASAAEAQFGGALGRARQKIDRAKDKAKPVTERAERAADTFQPWSSLDEQQIGEATAAKLIAMFGLVEDEGIARYVNLTGQTVARFSPRALPYTFGVLNTDIVGLYALPGGYIFITRAALSGMTNEAQLAGALAHEIYHCAERHLESEVRSNKTSVWAIDEARINTAAGRELVALRADALLKDLFTTSLSRDKEAAADAHGMEIAAQAGYHPAGLLEFLQAMKIASAKPENKRRFGQFLSTHPSFDGRIADLELVVGRAEKRGKTLEERFRAAVQE
jgi:beta-barrel assembly-enhancing protease